MEMWLKQSTLVLFAAAVAGMVISAQFHVILDQTQRKENVPFGSSLVLSCRLRITQYQRSRVSWYFNPFRSSLSDSQNLSEKVITQSANTSSEKTNQDLKDEQQDIEETYFLSNVTHEDSGWYFCKVTVEIPVYIGFNSNGTQVNITLKNLVEITTYPSLETSKQAKNLVEITTYPSLETSKQANSSVHGPVSNWWMWIVLGVSGFILIVLLVMCILLRRRCNKSREPDPIYINTRPMVNKQPSPRPSASVDKLKMGSASQHLRTPSPGRRYEEGNRRQRH